MAVALKTTGLTKEYGELVALAPLDLKLKEGELVAMVGHNGSGKSTFLNLAAGLLMPSDGTIEIAGAAAGSLEARASASYLPDTPVLYDDLSVREHISTSRGCTARTTGSQRRGSARAAEPRAPRRRLPLHRLGEAHLALAARARS